METEQVIWISSSCILASVFESLCVAWSVGTKWENWSCKREGAFSKSKCVQSCSLRNFVCTTAVSATVSLSLSPGLSCLQHLLWAHLWRNEYMYWIQRRFLNWKKKFKYKIRARDFLPLCPRPCPTCPQTVCLVGQPVCLAGIAEMHSPILQTPCYSWVGGGGGGGYRGCSEMSKPVPSTPIDQRK